MNSIEQIEQKRRELQASADDFVGYNDPRMVDLVPHTEDPREKIKGTTGTVDGFLFGGAVFAGGPRSARQLYGLDHVGEQAVKQN